MKRKYLFAATFWILSCTSGSHYTINCKIEGSDGMAFYLMKRNSGQTEILDSAVSQNGSFSMKGRAVSYPVIVQLIAGNRGKQVEFYLENSVITVIGKIDSLDQAEVTGSKTQDEYNSLLLKYDDLNDLYSDTYREYKQAEEVKNAGRMETEERKIDSVKDEIIVLQKDYIKGHPGSYIIPAILTNLSNDLGPDTLDSLLNCIDISVASLPEVKILSDRIKRMRMVSIGRKAPDFTLNDPAGKPVSLSSRIGSRLLLIDFWASWCEPCRKENPNIVKVYNEFHDKGFDILGVSLDRNQEDWTKAISDDRLIWTHVSDLRYWQNEAVQLYAINSIPSNFLLDDRGIIIGKDLYGKELYDKVKKTLIK